MNNHLAGTVLRTVSLASLGQEFVKIGKAGEAAGQLSNEIAGFDTSSCLSNTTQPKQIFMIIMFTGVWFLRFNPDLDII